MVKLSRVEEGLSHELGVWLGYAQPRPEYCALWRPRGWEAERQYSRSFSRSTTTLCGGCSISSASPARPQAASSRIAFMVHAIPLPFPPPQAGEGYSGGLAAAGS